MSDRIIFLIDQHVWSITIDIDMYSHYVYRLCINTMYINYVYAGFIFTMRKEDAESSECTYDKAMRSLPLHTSTQRCDRCTCTPAHTKLARRYDRCCCIHLHSDTIAAVLTHGIQVGVAMGAGRQHFFRKGGEAPQTYCTLQSLHIAPTFLRLQMVRAMRAIIQR